jgi:hypothetical protein
MILSLNLNYASITIPLPDKKLHAHNTGHWRSKAPLVKAQRAMAHALMTSLIRSGRAQAMPRATLTLYVWFADRRRRDARNVAQGCKGAIDGCIDAGLLPDDDWQHLADGGTVCDVDKMNPRVELRFTPWDGPGL